MYYYLCPKSVTLALVIVSVSRYRVTRVGFFDLKCPYLGYFRLDEWLFWVLKSGHTELSFFPPKIQKMRAQISLACCVCVSLNEWCAAEENCELRFPLTENQFLCLLA